MRIIFICGSLEPGKDGVGDYVRRLAGELIRQGNSVLALSLNDKYIQGIWEGAQEDGNENLKVLRLPTSYSWNLRIKKAKEAIRVFNPEWLSLQFVPFSFHSKGLPFFLSTRLSRLGKGIHWHIMFHELWVGMDRERTVKHYWWGKVQKHLIKALIYQLQPRAIHTQTQLYQKQLAKIGYKAQYLPLFSNIKVVQKCIAQNMQNSNKCKRMVIFGLIQENCPIAAFAQEAATYIKEKREGIVFIFLGRLGHRVSEWKHALESESLNVRIEGEQSAEAISHILSTSDYGLSSTPLAQIEKSGTVAAMRAHGLPVICVGRQWDPVGIENLILPDGIYEYQQDKLKYILEGSSKYKMEPAKLGNSLPAVTNMFLSSLLN